MSRGLPALRRGPLANAASRLHKQAGVVLALVILVLAATYASDRFLTVPNLLNVLRQVAIVGILAVGQTFAILTAGIDLSVGAVLGLSVVLFARLLEHHGLIIAIPLGLLSGAAAGLVNGIGVAYGGIPPFIMTLGMLSFARADWRSSTLGERRSPS